MSVSPDRVRPFNPRLAAFRIVGDVVHRYRTIDRAEAVRIPEHADPRDRAFCRRLAFTCLRRHGELRYLTRRFIARTPRGRGEAVETVVRLGLAQLLFMDVPAYAAVDATVDLCRMVQLDRFTKLVNAVMRRASNDICREQARQDGERLNAPDWLWQRWCDAYGEAATRAMARAHTREPPLDVCVRDPATTVHWAERLGGEQLAPGLIRLWPSGPVQALPGFEAGAWWVQDAAAGLPVRLLGDVRGLTVADLCAAPGGKTLQLAARGATVTAVDRSVDRLRKLTGNLTRTGLAATVVVADVLAWSPPQPFDAVLLDAPCSATGTIRRNPDIPWIRRPGDVDALADLQARLLRRAIDFVKPGGLLVYCTCSLQPEEGEMQIERALNAGWAVERLPVMPEEPVGPAAFGEIVTGTGDIRTLPGGFEEAGSFDGFFAARLRRL